MSTYLGYTPAWLESHNALHTAREISQQPRLWRELGAALAQQQPAITAFLQPLLSRPQLRIILTGAGTSAFVGEAAAPFIQAHNGYQVRAIATTDLVSNPEQYFDPHCPTLLVSFARSGNSPESVAAVTLADQFLTECHHLFVTCNPDGALSRMAHSHHQAHCVLMPAEANDKSFAMTSSFSCMLMTTLALFSGLSAADIQHHADTVALLCTDKLSQWQPQVRELAELPYQRLIVLGSGGFAGLAREAALKSLELSAGQVITAFDSSLGFRHGPKFTINGDALVIQFIASDRYTRRYDTDLYAEIQRDQKALRHIALSETAMSAAHCIELGQLELSDAWLSFPYILFCQMLAFEKSLQLGLGPDNPCPTGEVNRVVQGVTIYPFDAFA
ncbi:MAG: SIS domain-containing protein [Plesiomonas shigelloides]